MKLNQSLEGKKVRITDIDGEIFEGIVGDYIFPEDNEPEGISAIDIYDCPQRPGQWIGFLPVKVSIITVPVSFS